MLNHFTRRCPLCDVTPTNAGSRYSSHARREFHFGICPRCGIGLVLDPREDYDALYDHEYYLGRGADPKVRYLQEMADPRTIRHLEWSGLEESLTAIPRTAKILDFGCGLGGLVRHLRKNGWNAEGFEDEGYARRWVLDHDIPLAESLAPASYDVVFAVEVVEHLIDPIPVLKIVRAAMKPGGRLIITTGNFARARQPLPSWSYSVIPDVHVTFWTPQTWETALVRAGFEVSPPTVLSPAVTQYKILKALPNTVSPLRNVAPWWRSAARVVDRRYGVSAFADGLAA